MFMLGETEGEMRSELTEGDRFLMLPATFDDDPMLRVSKSVIGIFAVALLTAGFSTTALLCFAVRNPIFQAEAIFMPSFSSCLLGLLTVFYDCLISSRFNWNTPALLVTIAAAVSTVVYGGLLLWTYRKISDTRSRATVQPLHARAASIASDGQPYQAPSYYENYVRNMYPTSAHQSVQSQATGGYDPNSITEEEMQRQQMLMLLLQKEQQPSPDPSSDTFRLDWQIGQEQETPIQGYYAPGSDSAYSQPSPQPEHPRPGLVRQLTQEGLRPWDGVWRGVAARRQPDPQDWRLSHDEREMRRRQIEMGLR